MTCGVDRGEIRGAVGAGRRVDVRLLTPWSAIIEGLRDPYDAVHTVVCHHPRTSDHPHRTMSDRPAGGDAGREGGEQVGVPRLTNESTTTTSMESDKKASSTSTQSVSGWGAHGPVARLIDELIGALRPTPASDRRRRAVFRHITELVNGCFQDENVLVTAFGSVPLRTYLPDGDIDVCLLGPHSSLSKEPCWTQRLRDHIEFAEADDAANGRVSEFAVSEIHVVHAEVRLMKCICDGVVVDVSANQFGGLATLGFLEEVDSFISDKLNSDGLFKRSIVLIKAWGFYEGRLLGAHHALISTYALGTFLSRKILLALYCIVRVNSDGF